MATKQLYATGTFRYANRMMQAGDPVDMSAPHAKLYMALGKVSDEKPKQARAPRAASSSAEVSMSLKKDELLAIAAAEGIAVETDDNKADLIRKIEAGRK